MYKCIYAVFVWGCSVLTVCASFAQDATDTSKSNTVYTKKGASLSFEYTGNTSRPVNEFKALVVLREDTSGDVTVQSCAEKKEYKPGNYYIEINAFPLGRCNLDLNVNDVVVMVPQPGFASFLVSEEVSTVTLYEQIGYRYLSFHTFSAKDVALQHLQIQPGSYEAHFHKPDRHKRRREKVVRFRIKPTKERVVKIR